MGSIVEAVGAWIMQVITSMGYLGIVLLMGIESACIPLPSEIIMPFGGFLVYQHPEQYNIWLMGVAGALGCVWGSALAYVIGATGGRPFILKYGKYVLIGRKDMDHADAWFKKYGDAAVFISRLLPVIRTFISLPAGIARVNFLRFVIYTFLGSFPWCLLLAWAGKALGEQWDKRLKAYFHGADAIIITVVLVAIVLYVYRHIKSERDYEAKLKAAGGGSAKP
jgi:membrane protein DedA with SNARE-associated domain